VSHEEMEEMYGPLATHSEHKIDDQVRYKHEGRATTGKVIWVCAARPEQTLHLCYVVLNDERNYPDFVFPADVLMQGE
jgi:hypothetical protein